MAFQDRVFSIAGNTYKGEEVVWSSDVYTAEVGWSAGGTALKIDNNGESDFDINLYPPLQISENAKMLQDKIKAKWPEILEQAKEFESKYPDPIQSLVDLFSSLPGDYDSWRQIVDEPYG